MNLSIYGIPRSLTTCDIRRPTHKAELVAPVPVASAGRASFIPFLVRLHVKLKHTRSTRVFTCFGALRATISLNSEFSGGGLKKSRVFY